MFKNNKNIFLSIVGTSLFTSTILFGSGWKLPEQSVKSVALSGAYISNANGADTAYYNPANMSFNTNKFQAEVSLMNVKLSSIDYKDNRSNTLNSDSLTENIVVPTIFLTSNNKNNYRYGLSITAPGGLSKRWDDSFAKTSAQEFTLKIIELNPSISYLIKDNLSFGFGLRVLYSEGIVKSDGIGRKNQPGIGVISGSIKRDMKGDTIEYGYNFAISYKPSQTSNLSMTYRSKVSLNEEGNAKLSNGLWTTTNETTIAAPASDNLATSVKIPLPATLTLSYSFDYKNTTIELEYDKTYWSVYENLDFNYERSLSNAVLTSAFDDSKSKNWKDTNAFRIGVTHKYNDKLDLLFGFAKDETPAPEESIGFELPDSDATLYSLGFNYKLKNDSSIGFAYLYDKKESRTVKNSDNKIDGEFSNASAHLVSLAYRVDF